MTRPLAITAKTPIASNTCVQTPAHEKISCNISGTVVQHLPSRNLFQSLNGLMLMGPEICRLRCYQSICVLSLPFSLLRSPISLVFLGTKRRWSRTILMASRRISNILLMRAKRGARGNAATKMVVKLNWITAQRRNSNKENIFLLRF